MQQNYINPEKVELPDLASVKRQIEFKNYQFNQQQIQRRSQVLKRQKLTEVEQSSLINQRRLIQLQNDKLKEMDKKYRVQDALQREYDRQIYTRERIKTEQRSYDRIYSQKQRQMLDNYQQNRIHEMSRIYQIGTAKTDKNKYLQNRSLLTEGCEDSLDNLRHQSSQQLNSHGNTGRPMHFQPTLNVFPQTEGLKTQKNSLSSIQQPSLQNSRTKKYSAVNLQYSDYLKQQINRKQREKQQQKRKQLEKDKTWMNRQNQSYYESLEEMKFRNQKKKWDYATGLQKQLLWKKEYQQRL